MNPLNAYKETKIKTASQGQLIVLLYDEAIKNLDLALKALSVRHEKFDEVNRTIVKAQDIVTELMVSLDMDRGGEIAKGLFNLYVFFNEQLMQANMKKDEMPIKTVRKMMDELRASWVEIASQNPTENAPAIGGVNIAG
jgi:flagellar protein FliS